MSSISTTHSQTSRAGPRITFVCLMDKIAIVTTTSMTPRPRPRLRIHLLKAGSPPWIQWAFVVEVWDSWAPKTVSA